MVSPVSEFTSGVRREGERERKRDGGKRACRRCIKSKMQWHRGENPKDRERERNGKEKKRLQ